MSDYSGKIETRSETVRTSGSEPYAFILEIDPGSDITHVCDAHSILNPRAGLFGKSEMDAKYPENLRSLKRYYFLALSPREPGLTGFSRGFSGCIRIRFDPGGPPPPGSKLSSSPLIDGIGVQQKRKISERDLEESAEFHHK